MPGWGRGGDHRLWPRHLDRGGRRDAVDHRHCVAHGPKTPTREPLALDAGIPAVREDLGQDRSPGWPHPARIRALNSALSTRQLGAIERVGGLPTF